MSIQDKIIGSFGKIWCSWKTIGLWPYPALIYNNVHSMLTWDDYRKFTMKIKIGDILISRSAPYLFSNIGIPGFFKHAAIYTGTITGVRNHKTHFITPTHFIATTKEKEITFKRTIVHAIGEGVVCQDFGEMFFHADYIVALRPFTTEIQQDKIIISALKQVGRSYDFKFNKHEKKKFYCTELAAYCINEAAIERPQTTLITNSIYGLVLPIRRFKTQAYVADSFLAKYPIVCVSKSCENNKIME